jgi:hypothetical protein
MDEHPDTTGPAIAEEEERLLALVASMYPGWRIEAVQASAGMDRWWAHRRAAVTPDQRAAGLRESVGRWSLHAKLKRLR